MADIEPTYYNVGHVFPNGVNLSDVAKSIFNLWKAVSAICNNLDVDAGTLGTDYMSKIGTDLNTAMANIGTPEGTST